MNYLFLAERPFLCSLSFTLVTGLLSIWDLFDLV